jgi:hypothetical protein
MPIPRNQISRSVSAQGFTCETLDLGLDGFRECPEVGPTVCDFAVPFGYGFLCRHPDCGEPRENAQTQKSARQIVLEQDRG